MGLKCSYSRLIAATLLSTSSCESMQKRDLINPRKFLLQASRFRSLFPRDNPHLHSLSLLSHVLNDSYDSHFSKPTFKPFSELGFRRTPDVGVGCSLFRGFILPNFSKNVSPFGSVSFDPNHSQLSFHRSMWILHLFFAIIMSKNKILVLIILFKILFLLGCRSFYQI